MPTHCERSEQAQELEWEWLGIPSGNLRHASIVFALTFVGAEWSDDVFGVRAWLAWCAKTVGVECDVECFVEPLSGCDDGCFAIFEACDSVVDV